MEIKGKVPSAVCCFNSSVPSSKGTPAEVNGDLCVAGLQQWATLILLLVFQYLKTIVSELTIVSVSSFSQEQSFTAEL